jgi:hypothetical protein
MTPRPVGAGVAGRDAVEVVAATARERDGAQIAYPRAESNALSTSGGFHQTFFPVSAAMTRAAL